MQDYLAEEPPINYALWYGVLTGLVVQMLILSAVLWNYTPY